MDFLFCSNGFVSRDRKRLEDDPVDFVAKAEGLRLVVRSGDTVFVPLLMQM